MLKEHLKEQPFFLFDPFFHWFIFFKYHVSFCLRVKATVKGVNTFFVNQQQ